ncbi:mucosa-associated lymphoid tissue lymphoma translocation protein 1 homolog [Bombina bombina]|uniref:mucosa-associated lymphoid tissue lymphoma translocation protein 1 homolog n=1 Tax=Bombina bombina TaxID=8345 RepID=UPI00235AE9BF|nr:mucosa-associated lymphoid tissue lymphoma translocation protein 1 homolog [Bombina bombina]XP_053573242.1 mucosa-associated lymphoid tissue lymphoma translocation protein 1 homolog [Bombina bombina]XP_053573243.1 mucosa-associated lymphoid tissue lymphoma translocation protein 1 homolog [Bombina bombina]
MLKEIVITEQPVSACVPLDFPLTLCCKAQAPAMLHYQWFQWWEHSCKEIPGGNQPDLHIVARQTQLYVCRISDQHQGTVFSQWVKVKVINNLPKGFVPPSWQGEPLIVTQPESVHVTSQHPVQLHCCALGIPAPQFQWYLNGNCLAKKRRQQIQIKTVKPTDCGSYLCCVSNVHGERWSESADITLGGEDVQTSQKSSVSPGRRQPEVYFAAGKVALLIGNNSYLNHPNLLAPMVDVWELSILLRSIGFCVISLVDVTHTEMLITITQFLHLLDRGAYGLFYYAGHGYERSGRNYMVPIDAPQPYKPENCISVQKILQKMQDRKTALNVVLLDTCRKWYNSDCSLSKVYPLKPWGNTVYGFATCENSEAYEVQDGEFSSGIFVKYLKKHILKEKKVTHMLEEVLEDIGRDPLVTGKQVMEIRHSLNEPRSLTDPICTSGSDCLRRINWEQKNEMPKQAIQFSCGVEVELRFQKVFSNLTHTFARLTSVPSHLTDIRVILCKSSEMAELSLTSSCRPHYLDSLLALSSDGEEADSMLRLHGLQKCQNDIILKIDLHYSSLEASTRFQETMHHTIPKPWIARLLSGKDATSVCKVNEAGATLHDHMTTKPTPLTTNSSDNKPPAHRLDNAGRMPCSAQSKSCSEPEENDESDIFTLQTTSDKKESFCTVRTDKK